MAYEYHKQMFGKWRGVDAETLPSYLHLSKRQAACFCRADGLQLEALTPEPSLLLLPVH